MLKKKLKLVLVTSALLVGGAGFAAAAPGPVKAEHRAKLLEKFDVNKDGKLDRAEKLAMKETLAARSFARMDKDGDGKLSLDEFKAGHKHAGAHHRRGGKRL